MPRSRVFWYMNFLPRRQDYLGEIAQALVGTGVVMGGPDVLPENPALARQGLSVLRKFRGPPEVVRLDAARQLPAPPQQCRSAISAYWSMEDMFLFARDRLHVDYLFWEYRTKPSRPIRGTGTTPVQ